MAKPTPRRAACVTAAAALALAALAPGTAAAAPRHETITAKVRNNNFVYAPREPEVRSGGRLTIRNRTSVQHTFSIVKRKDVPRTRKQKRRCSRPGHICRKIFNWHDQGEDLRVNAGAKGFNRPGDSVLFEKSVGARVTANDGRTLNFICGIHPEMQGKLRVR